MEKNYLKGVIDTHVHSSPDVRERKMSDIELMEEGVRRDVRGIVIKSTICLQLPERQSSIK
ncbi:hypothetical protein DXA13_12370 [Clostridium sp. AM58-1XD]|nr:hypothetical protein DXA13_12370 [Clostridium sp. AM58-1XD]